MRDPVAAVVRDRDAERRRAARPRAGTPGGARAGLAA